MSRSSLAGRSGTGFSAQARRRRSRPQRARFPSDLRRRVLLLWGVYAIAVARGVRRLPLAKTVLGLVAAIFLLRGLLGLPAVLWSHGAEAEALRLRMGFVVSTSAIALVLGLCYLHGVRQLWRETSDTKAR